MTPRRNPMAPPARKGNTAEPPQCAGQTSDQLSSLSKPKAAKALSNLSLGRQQDITSLIHVILDVS